MVAIDIARIVTAESLLYGVKQKCKACNGTGEIAKTPTWKVPCDDCGGTGSVMGFNNDIGKANWKETLETYETEAQKGSW